MCEREQEIIPPPPHYDEIGGVRILWPVSLLEQRMLRVSLSFLDHSRHHQAITYALESVIEDGLKDDFGSGGEAIIRQWQRLYPTLPETFDKLDTRAALFSSWNKRDRRRRLVALLATFDQMYDSLHAMGRRRAAYHPRSWRTGPMRNGQIHAGDA